MKYGSVCSGIEAATVAWHPLGWEPQFFSEIEPFPCQVLAHHYPDVPNYGDMTKFKEWPDATIDVLVGGTPCQSFSVAGLRKGLDDPRGNLMLTYLAIADRYRPKWLVWENVPGILSSGGGRDFGTFLGGLGELGYGFAYRVLDAQYAGVPQRRRRVFVVGYLGDWRRAAAVLFERHSLQGHTPPRRKAGAGVAGTFKARASSGGWGQDIELAAGGYMQPVSALTANGVGTCGADDNQGQAGHLIPHCMATGQAAAEIVRDGSPSLTCNHEAPIVTHTLRGEGFDASEDGTGRGTPLVPCYPINTQIATRCEALGEGTGLGIGADSDPAYTLQAAHSHAVAMVFMAGQGAKAGSVAASETTSPTLKAAASGLNQTPSVAIASAVRRLTPEECELLQGFPKRYTLIPVNKKGKMAADGPRYKALGNSMNTDCMEWIGRRIQMVEDLMSEVAA